MNILLVGSGGREHAIALQIIASKGVEKLFVAPGNAGTGQIATNVNIKADAIDDLVDFAFENSVDLVVVGPEVPLSLGIADEIKKKNAKTGKNVLCFGPTQVAAELESSKAFSKKMMIDLDIPTAEYDVFSDFYDAVEWVKACEFEFVIKLSGLASGKGVFIPKSKEEAIGILYKVMHEKTFGDAATQVVLEEKLVGEEVSILAFCDGQNIAVMPSSQDHKRLKNNDEGLNTGGMGAYAPAPVCLEPQAEALASLVISPIIQELFEQGTPYVGVLYAGVMLTDNGPKVLEYNCRFGDPETQVLMALLDSDLVKTMVACCKGELPKAMPKWKNGYAATVVMASEGYPEKSSADVPLNYADLKSENDVHVIHAGTIEEDGQLYAHGGRVLAVTGVDENLQKCLNKIYDKIRKINFPNCHYRTDIGMRGITLLNKTDEDKSLAYSSAGVNIDAGNKAVQMMGEAVKSTYTPAVLSKLGSFGGLFDTAELLKMDGPILVGSTDGVGTKVKLAAQVGKYESIGMDIVNHCIDDILVQGAKPLFFLDYFATSKLKPEMAAEVVQGMAKACKASGCALIGGETAEMPGVYMEGEFDIAGTIVGVVERDKLLPKENIQAGDVLIGLASDSPHTNGYSLVRKIFEGQDLNAVRPELGESLASALLRPHRAYLNAIYPILQNHPTLVKGLAHITGGGFLENIPRVLPDGLNAIVNKHSWEIPALYKLIQKTGNVPENEMYRIFNMGIGLIVIVSKENCEKFQKEVGEKSWIIGELQKSSTNKSETILK